MSTKYSMLTKHSTPLALAGMLYQLWPTVAIYTHRGATLTHYTCFFFAKPVTTSKSYQMPDSVCIGDVTVSFKGAFFFHKNKWPVPLSIFFVQMGDSWEGCRARTDNIPVLFDLTTTEIWTVLVVTTQLYEGYSRDTQASLRRDQARFESPPCCAIWQCLKGLLPKYIVLESVLDLIDCTLCQIHHSCAKP